MGKCREGGDTCIRQAEEIEQLKARDKEWIELNRKLHVRIAKFEDLFKNGEMIGADIDEPEGTRYMVISATLIEELLDDTQS